MDKLKEYIDTHREAFDDDLLPQGHYGRFERKLPRGKAVLWVNLVAVAAAAAVAFFVYTGIQGEIGNAPVRQTANYSCETQQEIEELRLYYNMQMEDLYAQIRALYKTDQAPGGLELLEETKKVLKTSEDFEQKILPGLPRSEEGLFAMNQHYNTSLQSLDIMLRQMENVIDNDLDNNL